MFVLCSDQYGSNLVIPTHTELVITPPGLNLLFMFPFSCLVLFTFFAKVLCYLHKVGSSCVDIVHEVILLHGCLLCSSQIDGTCIIDNNIYPTKLLNCLFNGLLNLFLVSDVDNAWKCLPSSCFNWEGTEVM